jgi:UDP-glucose 4-epimerase
MNILITGVAGLLGSRFCTWILDNTNHNVIGIDDLSGGYIENVDDRCSFYKLDLVSDVNDLEDIFNNTKIDIVYHMAAYAAEGLSPFIRKYNYENNLIASVNLINLSINKNIKRFVFTSTMAVYGDQPSPFSEEMTPKPIDPYGVAKFSVEQDLAIAKEQHNLDYTIIRPHNVYGVNQNIWDKYRNVLGIWMLQILNCKRPTIYGDGQQTRAFSFIDDCLEPLWISSQNKECIGEVINLGGTREISILDACNVLLEVTKSDLNPIFLEGRHEVKHAYATWEKSVRLLKYKEKTTLEEGIRKMWEWAKSQPNREQFTWKEYEIDKNIYSYWKKK